MTCPPKRYPHVVLDLEGFEVNPVFGANEKETFPVIEVNPD